MAAPAALLTLQVGHGDVGVDAVDGPAGLEAAVPARLVVPLTLVRRVVVVAEDGWGGRAGSDWGAGGGSGRGQGLAALTAQVGRPPEHAGALLGALLGVGGHGRAEALAVAARVAGAAVVHAGLVEGLGVHLGGSRRAPGSTGASQGGPPPTPAPLLGPGAPPSRASRGSGEVGGGGHPAVRAVPPLSLRPSAAGLSTVGVLGSGGLPPPGTVQEAGGPAGVSGGRFHLGHVFKGHRMEMKLQARCLLGTPRTPPSVHAHSQAHGHAHTLAATPIALAATPTRSRPRPPCCGRRGRPRS